jgi:hypothetical protein
MNGSSETVGRNGDKKRRQKRNDEIKYIFTLILYEI